jgi:hypothetical protein
MKKEKQYLRMYKIWYIALFLTSFCGGGISVIAQPSGSDDFMLERLRFQSLMGYWMSEPLYAFTVSQATLEDYCSQDLKQAYRRIDELSLEQGDIMSITERIKAKAENCAALLDGQTALLDESLKKLNKEHARKVRWRRITGVGLSAGFIGGLYIGSR